MLFTSINFLFFTGVLIILYYHIPPKRQWQLLLAASYFFYIHAGARYLVFILFTTVTVYFCALKISDRQKTRKAYIEEHGADLSREQKKAYKSKVKKANRKYLISCLAANFIILALCKACLTEPFCAMAKGGRLTFLTAALPLGISFYMFQSAGYLIDVYHEKAKAEKNFFRFALFVSFFPQLIQGPISKFNMLAPSLFAPHKYDPKRLVFGMQRMLWGYFKKLVVADRIAPAVIALRGPEYMGAGFAVLSAFYAIQLYCDFTGGIDVAIGLSEALGVTLPENFARPYFSKNIAEYWRRWHITLGEWMKAYIFYPISVSRPVLKLSKAGKARAGKFCKHLPVYIATVATWLVTGIWHGLTFNFILWGMMNCFVIMLSQEMTPLYKKFHKRFRLKEKPWYGGFEILRMFVLMNFIRVCDLFPHVGDYFARMGSLFTKMDLSVLVDGSLMNLGISALDYAIIGVSLMIIFSISLIQEIKGSVRELLWKKPAALRCALTYGTVLAVVLLGSYGMGYDKTAFIYNQF